MLLQNKNAVIYGAGGSLGGTVAKALAAAGARVFLTGRNLDSVQRVADEILLPAELWKLPKSMPLMKGRSAIICRALFKKQVR